MAYFQYLAEIKDHSSLYGFTPILENFGFIISKEFSTPSQLYAEIFEGKALSSSKVNVLISWANKSSRLCLIEVRSEEPHLKKDTFCKRTINKLRDLIPPKEVANDLIDP
tara:strand:- start:26 stop:355 length:330 start_codon:yes stop_codon:yes gene_type:complete